MHSIIVMLLQTGAIASIAYGTRLPGASWMNGFRIFDAQVNFDGPSMRVYSTPRGSVLHANVPDFRESGYAHRSGKSYAAKLYVEYLKRFPSKPVVSARSNQIWFDEACDLEEEDKIVGQKSRILWRRK